MYAISANKRKYSTTPIVELIELPNGKTEEKFICVVALPKKDGNILSETIVRLLNENQETISNQPVNLSWEMKLEVSMSNGEFLYAMKIYKDNTGCSLQEAKEYIQSIRSKYE